MGDCVSHRWLRRNVSRGSRTGASGAPVSTARAHLQVVRPDAEADLRALVDGVRAGNAGDIGRFFDRYESLVNRLVWRLLGAHAAHDDVVNATFETVLRRLHEVRSLEALDGWIRAVTVSHARMELRRQRWWTFFRRSMDREVLEHPDLSIPDEAQRERIRRLYRALGTMNADDRTALVLRHLEELELTEVAEAMGVSLATVKRRLARAEATLAARLRGGA